MDDLIDVCVEHMVDENFTEEQARLYMKDLLPKLDYWRNFQMIRKPILVTNPWHQVKSIIGFFLIAKYFAI